MHIWRAYVHIDGDECSIYTVNEFEISDALYEQIQAALSQNKPLRDCEFYRELRDLAEDSFDLAKYLDYDELEEPKREEYDSDEEYQEALDEYQDEKDSVWDDYSLESIDIDDPGDAIRFKQQFIGRVVTEYAGEGSYRFKWDTDECINYSIEIEFDENGKIINIGELDASGLESESVKSSSYGEAYPNYDYVADMLEEEFEGD